MKVKDQQPYILDNELGSREEVEIDEQRIKELEEHDEQEAEFTEENQSMNQQQEMKQSTETEHKDISEENKYESIKENEIPKDEKPSEGIQSKPDDREEEASKKGLWSRFCGLNLWKSSIMSLY